MKAVSLVLGGVLMLGFAGSASARCSGERNTDPSSACYTGYGGGQSLPDGYREVERIIIEGRRQQDTGWYESLAAMRYGSQLGAAMGISDTLKGAVDALSPILPKCATAPTTTATQTPDADAGYFLASNAIVEAFSGNWGSVRRGQRVDVRHPNGDVVRFIINRVTGGPTSDLSQRNVTIFKFGDGVASKADSPCS
jgi:hypothetical protein